MQETIRLRQAYKIKTPDAIIAATALVHGLTLVSRNVPDFSSISNLNVIDPWKL
ncbi:toxin-antitoxin system, toxin component, PIN domain protein [Leptospira santarosai str. 2000030832]|nr:toxin-antitoxin system, toxin component, PIN domain protein [Leptospira santarosai str. 2000030832]